MRGFMLERSTVGQLQDQLADVPKDVELRFLLGDEEILAESIQNCSTVHTLSVFGGHFLDRVTLDEEGTDRGGLLLLIPGDSYEMTCMPFTPTPTETPPDASGAST